MAYAGKSGESAFQPPNPANDRNSGRLPAAATGLAIGLVVGAGVALLLAPREGDELRQGARRRLRRLARRGRDAWLDLGDELRHARRKLRRARRRSLAAAERLADAEPA